MRPYTFDPNSQYVSCITLEVDFMQKNHITSEPYDTDEMAKEFVLQFPNQAFSCDQLIAFKCGDKKLLRLVVKEMTIISLDSIKGDDVKSNSPKTVS